MKCKRCGNQDPKYFFHDGNQIYCRKCVGFGRLDLGSSPIACDLKPKKHHCNVQLDFPLTKHQAVVVEQLNQYLDDGWDVFVYAACGAGKTEIVMKSIETYLNQGKQVGFAISRRQVVLEICDRLKHAFPSIEVVPVCEGYTEHTSGDLIVCTMHQLYRYHQGFDLLIMDEVDAFPYRGNELLEQIAKDACKGQTIYLSATPDETIFQFVKQGTIKMVELFQRPHGYPLVEPHVICMPRVIQWGFLLQFIRKHVQAKKQFLLFVPTIKEALKMAKLFSIFYRCKAFSSQTKQKEEILKQMRNKELDFLISTTVLERGITIHGIDVVIWNCDHMVFHEASLIQMIGRVGRSMKEPTGEGLFLCSHKTTAIKRCVSALIQMNQHGSNYEKQ